MHVPARWADLLDALDAYPADEVTGLLQRLAGATNPICGGDVDLPHHVLLVALDVLRKRRRTVGWDRRNGSGP